MTPRPLAWLSICALLCGCTVGPDYVKPETVVPPGYRFASDVRTAPAIGESWWSLFRDPVLSQHIKAVLDANQDFALALARHDESRAVLGIVRSQKYPAIGLDPVYEHARTSATVSNAFPSLDTSLYVLPADATYEVDLWGRIRRSVMAAEAQSRASADNVAAVQLSLAADAAVIYLLLRSDDREIAVLQETLKVRDAALQLTVRQNASGVAGDIDVARARADRALTDADLQEAQRQRERSLHALAILENRNPADFEVKRTTQVPKAPIIPSGLPSRLLERRPDVAEREQALNAASEQIGIAETAVLPSIQLTGSGGVSSSMLSNLLTSPSLIYAIGPAVHLPLFDGGRARGEFEAAQARYREVLAQYRSATLAAFEDVQNALSDLAYYRARSSSLHTAFVTSDEAARIARSRYDRGQASYFEVVDSERQALVNRRAEIQNHQALLATTVILIKALGGGWRADAPLPLAPAEPAPGRLPLVPAALAPSQ
jgi:outer membrane protein, multidrug efflux system